ncbi:MAG TPA: hypothetical protein P5528_04505 [Steroidobacteraceae bacterium]|nr:hypothetical protein [Steroidobacteraceae bacterium]HRX88688.1 hypothetical protein [Steroidobacteraceae bacterium]
MRGLATAAILIMIALVCVGVVRRLEAERRQLGRLPAHRKRLALFGALGALALAAIVAFALLR